MQSHKTCNKKDVICINCGYHGHTSKNCNFPITSFGLICYKIIENEIYYLMVQRKDSLCYTEFIRGKYDIKNIRYLAKLFSKMTKYEHNRILTNDFDSLWNGMWVDNTNNMRKEYQISQSKFNKLKNGYRVRSNNEIIDVDVSSMILKFHTEEPEWEFPKGRRKINEKDLVCALREFEEETSISRKLVNIEDTTKQYEEIFIGTNNLRYRNIFYLAMYTKNNVHDIFFNSANADQIKEIKDVRWLKYDGVMEKIKSKIEKQEIFKRLHSQIMKTKNIN